MIRSFADKNTERLLLRENVKRFDRKLQRAALRKLILLDEAESLEDLRIPLGQRGQRPAAAHQRNRARHARHLGGHGLSAGTLFRDLGPLLAESASTVRPGNRKGPPRQAAESRGSGSSSRLNRGGIAASL